jgi:hypothetical protein
MRRGIETSINARRSVHAGPVFVDADGPVAADQTSAEKIPKSENLLQKS